MARLLELDVFELVDSGSMIGEGDIMSLAPTGNARVSAPSPSPAVEMGRAVGADFVVAPTLLYSQGVWRLTMRKLRIPDGKVDAIIQQNRRGDETAAYELITSTAERLMPEEAYQPRFAYIKAWMSDPPEPQPEPVPKALPPTPERRAQIRSKAARAWATNSQQEREPVACGRIQVVDFDWAFCEIYAPGNQFKANDEIFAWSGVQSELGASVVLKVSRVEGSKVIADFNRGANSQPLAVGNTIYRWEVKK